MRKNIRYVGLDVHAATIHVAIAEGREQPRSLGVIENRPEAVRRLFKKLGDTSTLRVCYEAGQIAAIHGCRRAASLRHKSSPRSRANSSASSGRLASRPSALAPTERLPPDDALGYALTTLECDGQDSRQQR